jgi:hypothetical protein
MRPRILLAAVLALCAALALTVPALANRAQTTLTITYTGDGFDGKVRSQRASCKRNRTVKVYKQKGGSPNPSQDTYTGLSDTSGDDGSWSTGNSGQEHGKFYARVRRNTRCKGAFSDTVNAH